MGLRQVLALPAYRRLFAAQTVSRWGDTFNVVALAIVVLRLTGSGLGVSAVVIAEIVPVLLFAPLAGAVVDRLPRVRVMVGADLWRALLAALLPVAAAIDVTAVYAVAFGLSLGTLFFNPAAASALPRLVDEDQLVAANSGLWSAAVLSQIVLAPLAGIMVATLGETPAFLVNAVTFLVSAGLLRGLALPPETERAAPAPAGAQTVLGRLRAGLRVLDDRRLRLLAVVQLLAALSAGATSALLVVYAAERLDAGPRGFGILLGAIGVGAVLGPLGLVRLLRDPRRPAFVFGPFVLRGVVDLVLAATRRLPVAVGALGVYGIGTSTGMVTYQSYLQAITPEDRRGRVFAGFDAIWQLGRLVSIGAGGALADVAGIAAVYLVGGLVLLAAGGLGLVGLRAQRGGAQGAGVS